MTVQGHSYDDNVGAPVNRNLIINGGMSVDQRRAGTALTAYNTTGSGFTADRFYCYMITDGAVTLQQVVDGPSNVSIYSSKVTVTTQDTSLSASQVANVATRLEGYSISNLAFGTTSARPFVLSFWIKSSVTGVYGVAFRNGGAWNRRYIATYTVNAANTWEQKTIAIIADTSGTWGTGSNLGIDIAWCLGAGTSESSTTGAWGAGAQEGANGQVNLMATLNATWQITGVQLEAGPVTTPFEFEPFETTLRKCQRYYELAGRDVIAYKSSNTTLLGNLSWRIPKRAVPSAVSYIAGSNPGFDIPSVIAYAVTAATASYIDLHCTRINITITTQAAGSGYAINSSVVDFMSVNAEL